MLTYIVGHPIKRPEDFYGRSQQVARFFEIVGGAQAQSVSVLGVRRAGKTSFLQYVAHRDVMARYLPNPRDYVMVYIDISSCKTPADFYQRLLKKLERGLGNTRPYPLWQSPPGEATLYDVEAVLCQHPNRRIILLLDEFDHIRSGAFDEDFLSELRAMTGVLDYELACVTASYWDLYQLGAHIGLPPTSPFYNIFYPTPIFLPGLEFAEVEQLVRQPAAQTGLLYVDSEIADIQALSGTLPFFVQATAAKWYEMRLYGMPPTYNGLLPPLVTALAPYFAQWWRSLDRLERALLHSLATLAEFDERPFSPSEVNLARRRLRAYGLIVPGLNGWMVNGGVFAEWLRLFAKIEEGGEETAVSPPPSLIELRRLLLDAFDYEELRTLCFDLSLDFDTLNGEGKGKAAKVREIILHMQRRPQGLERLITAIRNERGAII